MGLELPRPERDHRRRAADPRPARGGVAELVRLSVIDGDRPGLGRRGPGRDRRAALRPRPRAGGRGAPRVVGRRPRLALDDERRGCADGGIAAGARCRRSRAPARNAPASAARTCSPGSRRRARAATRWRSTAISPAWRRWRCRCGGPAPARSSDAFRSPPRACGSTRRAWRSSPAAADRGGGDRSGEPRLALLLRDPGSDGQEGGEPMKIIVTGASDGIGGAIALRLAAGLRGSGRAARPGADRQRAEAGAPGAARPAGGAAASATTYLTGDLADPAACTAIGGAGAGGSGRPRRLRVERRRSRCRTGWRSCRRRTGTGPSRSTPGRPSCWRRSSDAALAASRGSIVAVASMSGLRPHRGLGAYSAAKAALVMLARVLAQEWAADGIRVNAVAPGHDPDAADRAHLPA